MGLHLETSARLHGAGAKYASTRSVDIPVLELSADPDRLAKLLAETGIAHSKTACPTPARKQIRGFAGSALEKFGK